MTAGSAPMLAFVLLARLMGVRTLWIDSIANVEEVSLSGRKAGAVADLWLTQWEHQQRPGGPSYRGSVL